MKKRSNSLVIILSMACVIFSCISNDQGENVTHEQLKKNWEGVNYLNCNDDINNCVVIQLFSSESCYDCPESEMALNQLVKQQFGKDNNIVIAATHVDYWNDLVDGEDDCEGNWVDKYSNGRYTSQQFAYARKFKINAGTPQMVINGKELISDPGIAIMQQKIEEYKDYKSYYKLCLMLNMEQTVYSKNTLAINFDISINEKIESQDFTKNSPQLLVFLVERNIISYPDKGENCKMTLYHDNIARAVTSKTIRGGNSGLLIMEYPEDVKLENCSVLGFVQDLYSLEILGGSNGFYFSIKE